MTDFKTLAEMMASGSVFAGTSDSDEIVAALEEASELETALNEVCAHMAEYINEVDPMRKIGERKDGTPVYGTDRSVDLARMYLALKRDREPVRLTEEVRTVRRERDDALERVKVLERMLYSLCNTDVRHWTDSNEGGKPEITLVALDGQSLFDAYVAARPVLIVRDALQEGEQ